MLELLARRDATGLYLVQKPEWNAVGHARRDAVRHAVGHTRIDAVGNNTGKKDLADVRFRAWET
jgi:hypothetical protein